MQKSKKIILAVVVAWAISSLGYSYFKEDIIHLYKVDKAERVLNKQREEAKKRHEMGLD